MAQNDVQVAQNDVQVAQSDVKVAQNQGRIKVGAIDAAALGPFLK